MSPTDILPAPVIEAPRVREDKLERERQAFLRLLPELLETHRNQYVAIHDGQVVASGPDLVPVAMQAYGRFGYVPIYIDLVSEHPLPPVRVPSPRVAPVGDCS